MAIISKPAATVVRKAITVRMPEPVAETLHQYASFLGSSLDHVMVEALKLIFKKDAEFKAWQEQRRNAANDDAGSWASADIPSPASPPLADKKREKHRTTAEASREY